MKWINTRSHNTWLDNETDRIFEFGRNSVVPNGFGWIGNNGNVREEMGTRLWITARMLHCYSLAALMGRPGAYDLVEHGIKALEGPLKDQAHGGWFATIDNEGEGIVDEVKTRLPTCVCAPWRSECSHYRSPSCASTSRRSHCRI